MKKLLFVLLSVVVISSCKNEILSEEINIIPKPQVVNIVSGKFVLDQKTSIVILADSDDLMPAANFFAELFGRAVGKESLNIETEGKGRNSINVNIDSRLEREEYRLSVMSKRIDITGGTPQAVFYAFQTLRQLMPPSVENNVSGNILLPAVEIEDKPRFEYRGMHLDVCRHFFSVEDVKTYIDMLALHKFNTFHWHLTDDQGWRIEIKKYPNLTETGSKRSETLIGRGGEGYDGVPYGGFFTQDEVKEIVRYAQDRYITVIPEIELPGHATAALTSYPYLGCTGGPYEVVKRWGVFPEVFCAGKETTFEFLEGVFDEIIELFPSEYIHIGGDECPKDRWKQCPDCQRRIKNEGLKNEYELQSYFVRRIEKYLISKGRKVIGWDEILEGGVSKTATVMSWRGSKGGIEAAKMGNKVIMTPNSHLYFDYYQSKAEGEPLAIGGYVPMSKVYSLDPVEGLNDDEAKMVMGAQANLWTEYIADFSHVQYMVLPRMAALAEVVWSYPAERDFEEFKQRVEVLMERYGALGYNYRRGFE